MAKKGFFSWFRKDKPVPEVAEQQQTETHSDIDAERLATQASAAQEHAAKEAAGAAFTEQQAQTAELARIETERLAIEQLAAKQQAQAAELARIAAERLAAELLAAEQLATAQRAAEQLAAEQQAQTAELARIAAEHLAAELLAAEQVATAQLAAEQLLAEQLATEQTSIDVDLQDEPQAKPIKEGMFARLKRGLTRTSDNIGSGFIGLFRGKKINDALFEELEEQLLIADVGVETTTKLINRLTEHASRKQLKDAEALYDLMRDEMQQMLDPVAIPLVPENANGPFVILMIGVNGVGKTTTIGKLAKQYQSQGKSVMLAAGDTFRAAAVEQLQVWGQRNNIPVVAQHTGADSASVIFDALQAAKARKVDILIADTAGRLQNKSHLMEELKKVVRVMKKLDPDSPHEVMLTLDASTGQNAISQAQLFQEAVGVSGITISKLDGTAKGGVIFAIADKFSIPIRHIGVGEQIDDLRTFNASDFIEALFSQDKTDQ